LRFKRYNLNSIFSFLINLLNSKKYKKICTKNSLGIREIDLDCFSFNYFQSLHCFCLGRHPQIIIPIGGMEREIAEWENPTAPE
jgi:hypothetical protein